MGHFTKSFTCGLFVFLLTWTFILFSSSSGQELELSLNNRVFVALKGENLSIAYQLKIPVNQSKDFLTCFDPHSNTIYDFKISATTKEKKISDTFVVKNMTISGKYMCQFKTAQAFWFLKVRDSGYEEVWNFNEIILVSAITALLLVFSVGGTVYVFRGNWECCKTQNNKSTETQMEKEDTANVEPAQSTSFYASLEPRPRSVYDVLDHSTAASVGGQRDQTKPTTSKKKEAQKTVRDAPQKQEEGIFECVYENF